MAYDPTKPVDDSLAIAAELREQFAGLKAMIDGLQAQIGDLQVQLAERPTSYDVQQMILAQSAGALTHVEPLNQNVGDPPTQSEVQTVSSQLDALITELRR